MTVGPSAAASPRRHERLQRPRRRVGTSGGTAAGPFRLVSVAYLTACSGGSCVCGCGCCGGDRPGLARAHNAYYAHRGNGTPTTAIAAHLSCIPPSSCKSRSGLARVRPGCAPSHCLPSITASGAADEVARRLTPYEIHNPAHRELLNFVIQAAPKSASTNGRYTSHSPAQPGTASISDLTKVYIA